VSLGEATRTLTTIVTTIFAGEVSGTGGFIKQGAGALILPGTYAYSGNTVVGAGTLQLDGSLTTPVLVEPGGTLGGTGSAGNVTVNGILAPGAPDGAGIFTTTGALGVPGTARFRLFGNGVSDRLVASGGAALGGTVAVTLETNYTPVLGDAFDVIDGSISGSPALDLPPLAEGLAWFTNNFASSGVLSITNGSAPADNYANWLTNYPSLTGPDSLGDADPDGDGFNNNLEYAFGGNPTVGTPTLLKSVLSGSNIICSFVASTNASALTYLVESTTNLVTGPWTSNAVTTAITNSADQSNVLLYPEYVRRGFEAPATNAAGKIFYRIKANIAP
jgi:autotransporter-associated beta strand protein